MRENILFLAGFPRSGTTWFANILNAHSKIIYRHEIIGRNYHIFGEPLFEALKYNNGLTKSEFFEAIIRISEARTDTDKPPFFPKSSGFLRYKNLHYYAWIATKLVPTLSPFYKILFTTKKLDDFSFLIKETRSTINMDSILEGLRPAAILFLVRQPYGAIASDIKRIQKETASKAEENAKLVWHEAHKNAPYLKEINLTVGDLTRVSQPEFLAIQWRVYYDDLLRYSQQFSTARFFSYDDFVEKPKSNIKELLSYLKLDYDISVFEFAEESSGLNADKIGIVQKDAVNEYFSVYRQASFDHQSWRTILSPEDIKSIDKHTASTYEEIKSYIQRL